MKVLITGSEGFIGSNLTTHIEYNHPWDYELLMIDKNNGDDLLDDRTHEKIKEFQPSVIIHLAAISSLPECQSDPALAYQQNVVATLKLLETCRNFPIHRFIFAGTSAIYENNEWFPFTEEDSVSANISKHFEVYEEPKPDLIYSMSKKAAEDACMSYHKNYGMPITCLRFFNVYGPHQNKTRESPPLTAYILRELLANRSPKFFSNGTKVRDYIYIKDLINLIEAVIHRSESIGQIFNAVGYRKCYNVREIFNTMRQILGKTNIEAEFITPTEFWSKYPKLHGAYYNLSKDRIVKEVNKVTSGDCLKAFKLLDWEAVYDLRKGLTDMIDVELKSRNSDYKEYGGVQ